MIELWTDGASTGKVGPGGWAWLWDASGKVRWASGEAYMTTNSRMEMHALIEGLNSLPADSRVKVYCDSSMVVNGVRQGWVDAWRRKAKNDVWLNSRGKPVVNRDLWEQLELAVKRHLMVQIVHVKGHTKSTSRAARGNRRVDTMAHRACQRAKKKEGLL